ncbi:hypothetical protein A6K24_13080 [Metabacillus litoralis]|uniref:Uncharacterized protein n=1 Tax=Metabacillus litoralis TaxID=152268 RepID=A0A179SNR0_9BACI|nr:hypothetical protein A6K24_13080 [Metabacillus litoralis]
MGEDIKKFEKGYIVILKCSNYVYLRFWIFINDFRNLSSILQIYRQFDNSHIKKACGTPQAFLR